MTADALPSWAADAAARLAVLGFVDVHGSEPGAPGGPRLLVALRAAPTLVHFDPESIGYWRFAGERGRPDAFDRESERPADLPISWGRLRVVDRILEMNQFLTFGGRFRAVDLDPETTIVEIGSPAPILRWSGHSQGTDALTDEVGAFFGRLMIPIDYQPGAERRIGEAGPVDLFAAMLADSTARWAASRTLRDESSEAEAFVRHQIARLGRDEPAALDRGRRLLDDLGLSAAGDAPGRPGA